MEDIACFHSVAIKHLTSAILLHTSYAAFFTVATTSFTQLQSGRHVLYTNDGSARPYRRWPCQQKHSAESSPPSSVASYTHPAFRADCRGRIAPDITVMELPIRLARTNDIVIAMCVSAKSRKLYYHDHCSVVVIINFRKSCWRNTLLVQVRSEDLSASECNTFCIYEYSHASVT